MWLICCPQGPEKLVPAGRASAGKRCGETARQGRAGEVLEGNVLADGWLFEQHGCRPVCI
jgi:hypothetical protein